MDMREIGMRPARRGAAGSVAATLRVAGTSRATAVLAVLLAGWALTACSDEPAPPVADDTADSVFDPMTDTIDRAQGAEDALREAEQARRRQLEAME